MSRCTICDRSSDVDSPGLRMLRDKKTGLPICQDCDREVFMILADWEEIDTDEPEDIELSEATGT